MESSKPITDSRLSKNSVPHPAVKETRNEISKKSKDEEEMKDFDEGTIESLSSLDK